MSLSLLTFETGVSVVIPCLNEAETIGAAVAEAREGIRLSGMSGEVIVADNGSTDESVHISEKAGARVVQVLTKGYGAALHYGVLSAKYSYTTFADADLSYPFLEIPNLLRPLVEGRADFVLGSRLKGTIEPGAMPTLNRHIGTPILSALIRLLYRLPITDCNSGMRAFRTEIYRRLELYCPGMEYASEMIVRIAEEKVRYAEVPIQFRRDRRNRAPHLRRWRDGWRHLRFILGNSPSLPIIIIPGMAGFFLLLVALLISFQGLYSREAELHYHTAFASITLAGPLLIFSLMALVVKASRHNAELAHSRIVNLLHQWSENSAPFYIAVGFFFLCALELIVLFYRWVQNDFNSLSELPTLIRCSIFGMLGTVIFSLDLGLGLLKIIPYRKHD
jgi:glycosyltransferase involved in cell wall biosynthesis